MASHLLSVKEVATHMGISEQYVRSLIRRKRLHAERVGKSWVIPQHALTDFDEKLELPAEDRPRSSKRTPKLIALSFFSGAMGLDLGLKQAGIEVLLASEIDSVTRQTIVANHSDSALIGDISEYNASKIRAFAGLGAKDDIDLIVGGPPCQAFSTAGKREGFQDHRGNVFLTFIDRILELRPKYAVIENVRGLLSAPLSHRPHERRGLGFPPLTPEEDKGGALRHILHLLTAAGYGVSFNLYNAANFGSPQKRERVILVCSRDGQKLPYLAPTHSESGDFNLPKWCTVRNALAGMKGVKHLFVPFPEKRLKYYRLLKAGQYWKHLPQNMQRQALGASYFAGGGKTGFLRRVPWDGPSPTLVTHPAMPATDLAHPIEDRPLSVQEYMRLQEFPDDYKIAGTVTDQYRQIGNAVPVSLGAAIGRLIVNHMKGKKSRTYPNFPFSRYRFTDDKTWDIHSAPSDTPQLELTGLFG